MKSSDFVTLVLAGGQEKRLGLLTKEIPKPAVSFGGVYRLIDFTLSNCKHSDVGVIGVITQYRKHELADYIGLGQEWHSSRKDAEIVTLPPKFRNGVEEFYLGTADAIWKNIEFIEQYDPETILVLSGDHIYKMDYSKMLETHYYSRASVTIAALNVPCNKAPRFGIINADNNGIIEFFEEKPLKPKSNLASMGVYVFKWATLKNHLYISSIDPASSMDIGKDIIPQMLMCGEKLAVYRFDDYWKDIGDIYSLWEANMELLFTPPSIELHDDTWKIISRNNETLLRHKNYASSDGRIENSLVTNKLINKGSITNSIISADVEIEKGANIIDSVVMAGVKIGRGATVVKTIIGTNSIVGDYTGICNVKPNDVYLDNCQGVTVIGNNINIFTHSNGSLNFTVLSPPELCVGKNIQSGHRCEYQ